MLQDNIFTTVIQSSKLSEIPLHTVIYNAKDFSEIVCIKLPPQMPRDMELTEIYNLNSSEEVDFTDFVTRDENRPWIDIQASILDKSIGQHTYRMTFSRLGCKLSATCWFSYIIQDNNPEKPYIYMDRSEDSGDSGSSEN
jgi:hypothetical protein